jgi:molybdopterin synthase sulfur carrier subunit
MKLRVQYTAQLRTAVGRPEDELELPEGSSLTILVGHLAQRLHDVAAHLIAADGQINRNLLVVVNGQVVGQSEAATTVLHDKDVVLLLPPIAGG